MTRTFVANTHTRIVGIHYSQIMVVLALLVTNMHDMYCIAIQLIQSNIQTTYKQIIKTQTQQHNAYFEFDICVNNNNIMIYNITY